MRKRTFKFGMLALVALALTYCQREDAPEAPQQDPVPAVDPQAVVSLNEAKSLFEASENQKRTANSVSRRKYPFIELETDWRYFVQTQTLVGDAYSKIPITIVGSDLSAEMLFLKEDGVTEQYLFITEPDSLTQDNRIVNADFYLFTPKGEFISAYRMTDGVISHQLVPKVKGKYRLVVDAEAAQAGRKKRPKKIKGAPASIKVEGKTEDSGGLGNENGSGSGGGVAGGDGGADGDAPIQLEPVDVYGTRPVHYGSYPTYNGNSYENFTKGKDPKPNENDIGGGNGGGSSSSDVGVTIVKGKGGKMMKKLKTIDEDEDEKKEEKKQDKREDTIKDSLTNPCAKALLAQAPNLNNDIARLMRNTFGTSDKFNITVSNKYLIGATGSYNGQKNGDVINCHIFLDDKMLKTATQEYILVTLYHEVLHAFFDVERNRLGEEEFKQKYLSVRETYLPIGNGDQERRYLLMNDHSKFNSFIETLAQSILSFNRSFPLEKARALAKEGIVEKYMLSSEEKEYINEQKTVGGCN
ncbi:MAG: hypothetical protein E6494_05515 [Capnocytophaga sp.]|uniref:hypothetical protein n=1 Tax=Capnocytophaga sp. TaxID=44737 RepID=UPI00280C0370|nr:hypothetical protein [Capnocytophaga sp.]MDU6659558.1 hypothetical protein [Capnocytophaga sp.]